MVTFIYCKVITVSYHTSYLSHSYLFFFFFVVRIFKIYSLSNLQVNSRGLLAIIITRASSPFAGVRTYPSKLIIASQNTF